MTDKAASPASSARDDWPNVEDLTRSAFISLGRRDGLNEMFDELDRLRGRQADVVLHIDGCDHRRRRVRFTSLGLDHDVRIGRDIWQKLGQPEAVRITIERADKQPVPCGLVNTEPPAPEIVTDTWMGGGLEITYPPAAVNTESQRP